MVPETVLPFKLETTSDSITSHAGQICLKVRQAYYGLFQMIRRRVRIVSMA
ncbi:MAG: hypothetical protein P1S46_12030 [bacterium]|nr:hypothetical protein [bacterium]